MLVPEPSDSPSLMAAICCVQTARSEAPCVGAGRAHVGLPMRGFKVFFSRLQGHPAKRAITQLAKGVQGHTDEAVAVYKAVELSRASLWVLPVILMHSCGTARAFPFSPVLMMSIPALLLQWPLHAFAKYCQIFASRPLVSGPRPGTQPQEAAKPSGCVPAATVTELLLCE